MRVMASLASALAAIGSVVLTSPVQAEGSRNLYPAGYETTYADGGVPT